MIIKNKIRSRVSQCLDISIPEGRWQEYIELLDREGKFTKKRQLEMLFIICQSIEELENIIDDISFKIENTTELPISPSPNETTRRPK